MVMTTKQQEMLHKYWRKYKQQPFQSSTPISALCPLIRNMVRYNFPNGLCSNKLSASMINGKMSALFAQRYCFGYVWSERGDFYISLVFAIRCDCVLSIHILYIHTINKHECQMKQTTGLRAIIIFQLSKFVVWYGFPHAFHFCLIWIVAVHAVL